MTTGQFATYGGLIALLTIVVSCWKKISEIISSMQNVWVVRTELDKSLSSVIYQYCIEEMKLSSLRRKTYIGCQCVLKSTGQETKVAFELLSQNIVVFRDSWRIVMIAPGKWLYNPGTNDYERAVCLYLPRFMWNADKFIKNAIIKFGAKRHSENHRFGIARFYGKNKQSAAIVLDDSKRADRRPNSTTGLIREAKFGRAITVPYKVRDLVSNDLDNPFEWYAFPPYVLSVVEKAKLWHESKNWYKSKHIPWTRGWLVHGSPGTGKSLLLKCVAQYLDLPIFVFDLSSMNNEEFATFWEQACEESPCMILFEDFDAVFHGRNNITSQEQKLSFDCILNCVSGINQAEGIFLAVTTNNIKHIDAALGGDGNGISSRPGRIDDVIELQNMDETCRRIMATKLVAHQFVANIMRDTVDMTAAQFIEVCTQHALKNKFGQLTKAS